MMPSFSLVSYTLVFHEFKCISAMNRLLSATTTYISSSSFFHLCVPCYCDACSKSSALCVGMETLHNTLYTAIKQSVSFLVTKWVFANSKLPQLN